MEVVAVPANMETFNKTANSEDYFFYQRGNVTTNKIWGRPTYAKLRSFLEDIISTTDILDHYQLYLMGGILYSYWGTWDVDICLTGEIRDYRRLEMYMDLMYDISLNQYEMLIDAQWLEIPLPQVSFQELISPNFKNYTLEYVKTTYIIKQIGEEKSFFDLRNRNDVKVLTEFLVKGKHGEYPITKQKLVDRILGYPDKLLRSNMNVVEFLDNNEDYFLKNTNRF